MHENENVGNGKVLPPTYNHVLIWFLQKGLLESDAMYFFDHYSNKGWRNKYDYLLTNWKMTAWEWIWNRKESP